MEPIDAAGLPIGGGHPPRIMGVLNLSPDSLYGPNTYDPDADLDAAARFVEEELVGEGADIVDVGLQSANPAFEVLAPETELARLDAATALIERCEADAIFAIETRYAAVADAALSGGFDMVNDVCGFADPEMRPTCEAHDAAVVKMASPPDLERPGDVHTVGEALAALERGGLTEKTIVDPGFGNWSDEKTYEHDRERFRRLDEFQALDRPILTATNREEFLAEVTGVETGDALAESLAAATMEVARGADVIRTHDVAETRRAARVAHELREQPRDGERASERRTRKTAGARTASDP